MFLCDELYQMGLKARDKPEKEVLQIAREMLHKVIEKTKEETQKLVDEGSSPGRLKNIINRCNNHWNLAVEDLRKDGIDYFKSDGFIEFLKIRLPEIYREINSDNIPTKGPILRSKHKYGPLR